MEYLLWEDLANLRLIYDLLLANLYMHNFNNLLPGENFLYVYYIYTCPGLSAFTSIYG